LIRGSSTFIVSNLPKQKRGAGRMKIPFLQDPAEEKFLMQRYFYFFTFTFKPLTIDMQLNGDYQAAVSEIPVLLA
jgi:hypothetical protein